MVQLPELLDTETEAARAGFRTIADIGKERLRRSAKNVVELFPNAKDLDFGFRVLKVDTSNMQDVY